MATNAQVLKDLKKFISDAEEGKWDTMEADDDLFVKVNPQGKLCVFMGNLKTRKGLYMYTLETFEKQYNAFHNPKALRLAKMLAKINK